MSFIIGTFTSKLQAILPLMVLCQLIFKNTFYVLRIVTQKALGCVPCQRPHSAIQWSEPIRTGREEATQRHFKKDLFKAL